MPPAWAGALVAAAALAVPVADVLGAADDEALAVVAALLAVVAAEAALLGLALVAALVAALDGAALDVSTALEALPELVEALPPAPQAARRARELTPATPRRLLMSKRRRLSRSNTHSFLRLSRPRRPRPTSAREGDHKVETRMFPRA